jgi:WD40 repeat protein
MKIIKKNYDLSPLFRPLVAFTNKLHKFYKVCEQQSGMSSRKCRSIAFLPQACLAVGLDDGDIVLWTQAALLLHTLQGHASLVNSLAFNSNSSSGQEQQLLASGSSDCTVRLWDIKTKECVAVLEGHSRSVFGVAFSPGGCLLASASGDMTVQLWDVMKRKTASPVDVLRGHADTVWSVSFSPDGRQLASGSHDWTVRLWSMPEGVPCAVLQNDDYVFCVAFSCSNMLASGGYDGIIRLWDVGKSGITYRELQGHSNVIRSVAFSPDGSQLVSGSHDETARVWSVAGGKLLNTLTGHSDNVSSVAFHPNGKQVASGSADKTVRIWTVCEWSDRTHQLFGGEMKRLVFCLMCIKEKLSFNNNNDSIVPQLPMELWLEIYSFCMKEEKGEEEKEMYSF